MLLGYGEGGVGRWFSKGTQMRCWVDNVNRRVNFLCEFSGGNGQWCTPSNVCLLLGCFLHIVIVYNRSNPGNRPTIYLNGRSQNITEIAAASGTFTPDAGQNLTIANSNALNATLNAFISGFKIVNRALSADEAQALYVSGAAQPFILAPRYRFPVTIEQTGVLVNEQAGPWILETGSSACLYSDSGTRRYLRTLGAAITYTYSRQAYGAWYFRMDASSDYTDFMFISDDKREPKAASYGNGYAVEVNSSGALRLLRYDTGTPTVLYTTANGYIILTAEYEYFVARSPVDDRFRLYIRQPSYYPTWTLVTTQTDNTHTSSLFLTNFGGAAYFISDVILFSCGGDLTPNDIPYLED
jgi:hypothetical protein